MKMPGYWVEKTQQGVALTHALFDETDLDPATQAFRSATLTLPDGQVRELDSATIDRLKALSEGRLPPPAN